MNETSSHTGNVNETSSHTGNVNENATALLNANSSVTYIVNGSPIAVGFVHPERVSVHGTAVPQDSTCIEIIGLTDKAMPPIFPDEEIEDRRFLRRGCYYILPKVDIRRNSYKDGHLILEPFN